MKTQEELNAIKEEVETLNNKLAELNVEELEQVAGGRFHAITCPKCGKRALKSPNHDSILCEYCGNVERNYERKTQ